MAFTRRNIKKALGIRESAAPAIVVGRGTVTANGATTVNVANTAMTADSVVVFTLKTVGGTPAGSPYLFTTTPGTGFGVRAVAGDTSVYNYVILA
jgi:thiamine pyrophosphate-dependent acetolactate synthase large subunit-like protein